MVDCEYFAWEETIQLPLLDILFLIRSRRKLPILWTGKSSRQIPDDLEFQESKQNQPPSNNIFGHFLLNTLNRCTSILIAIMSYPMTQLGGRGTIKHAP